MQETELVFMSGRELAELIRTRKVSPVEVVTAFLDRTEALNPKVNAFITILRDEALAKAILQLAHHLGMRTIAEGVEDAAQVAALRALGCEYAQGNYFGRPLSKEEFETLLAGASRPAPKRASELPSRVGARIRGDV